MVTFKSIFAQDSAIEILRRAIVANHLPHGLIFAGPEGIGKATTALALASVFLCEKPKSSDPCGRCQSCQAISAAAHPDYHVITKELARLYDRSGTSKATQLPINVIRQELTAPAGRKTVLGQGKFFVIEQAQLMTPAAQNALLKTLEEPAGRTAIVLLATEPTDLLPTVRSRCQIIHFNPLPSEVVVEQLKSRGIAAAPAKLAAEFSDGSLGLALRWIADEVLDPAQSIVAALDSLLQGKPIGDLLDLLRKSAEAQAEKTIARDELTSKDFAMRDGLSLYLSIASQRLRQHLRDSSDPDFLDRVCLAVDAIALTEKYLDANVTFSLVLEQFGVALKGISDPSLSVITV